MPPLHVGAPAGDGLGGAGRDGTHGPAPPQGSAPTSAPPAGYGGSPALSAAGRGAVALGLARVGCSPRRNGGVPGASRGECGGPAPPPLGILLATQGTKDGALERGGLGAC